MAAVSLATQFDWGAHIPGAERIHAVWRQLDETACGMPVESHWCWCALHHPDRRRELRLCRRCFAIAGPSLPIPVTDTKEPA